ncbi:MAG: TRAP transporter TatT component family protein [Pseudomonadota bacterium]
MSFQCVRLTRRLAAGLLVALSLATGGCAISRVADNLPYGILDNDDPQLVSQALPSYIVAVDGLLATWPDDPGLLRAGSSLYGAYATLVSPEAERAAKFSTRALDYAFRAACAEREEACRLRAASFPEFEQAVKDTGKDDLPWLFALGSAWAGYLQTHSEDWNAIAELPRVQSLFERVLAIAPKHEHGMPQLYLGVMNSLLPPSLGGKPEVASRYYEESIRLSGGRNLYAKMLYARQYARLLYDRELHDRLLNEVVAAEPRAHGWTLANVYAQQEARRLLAEADDYF